ncbi:MAG TPA: hypothetical protein VFC56_05060 [Stellaceae bacterium]|nr:hypothetical protein [Stellaceae bacterium]
MSDTNVSIENTLSDDLLWGAEAIANEIGVSRRKAFYYLETGGIPAKKIGGLWVASRLSLRRHFGAVKADV